MYLSIKDMLQTNTVGLDRTEHSNFQSISLKSSINTAYVKVGLGEFHFYLNIVIENNCLEGCAVDYVFSMKMFLYVRTKIKCIQLIIFFSSNCLFIWPDLQNIFRSAVHLFRNIF